ncbi:MAG: NUDIX hydrolase [Ignavibacteriae bacterium]|nr:MAG: NUDIX hydrolase [Ignavibacteriota bacterium]
MPQHRIKLIADVAFFSENKVLLVKYSEQNKYDNVKGWFLPTDQLKNKEHPEDAALRLAKEQLNLKFESFILDNVESFTGHDRLWHMVFHFRIGLKSLPEICPPEDIETFSWFEIDKLPPKIEVAHHGWAIYTIEDMVEKYQLRFNNEE